MIEYKYKKAKGHDQKVFTENGHTMMEGDILHRLRRFAYLEEQQKAATKQVETEASDICHSISYSVYRDFLIDKTKSMEETAELLYRDQTYIDGIKNGLQNMRTHIKNGFKLHCS